ncbi:hypothetical protein [Streptosporangium longisporum]|uniref:Uncharacterized protein n=1 Tax=Streptosporangium longisporum TaxID=46187 RepID=A0ABN3Y393_9ACTN
MGFDFDGFIGSFSWFHWGMFILCGLIMIVSVIREGIERWRDWKWRKRKGLSKLSNSDVRELLEEQQARRAWDDRHSRYDRPTSY